jgi:hypothetical protein
LSAPLPTFFARLSIAFACFFRALGDAPFAALIDHANSSGSLPAAPSLPELAAPVAVTTRPVSVKKEKPISAKVEKLAPPAPAAASATDGALHLLAVFQREGRLLDFCEEELAGFSDAAVGAAARLVHTGCRKVLRENLELAPVRTEAEGARIKLEAGFDARAVRLVGNVVGSPPFSGALKHHGWKANATKFPEPPRGDAAKLLAPAEVELA